jgi:glycosyltransferase involved in cell wall biosynthesis
MFSVIIPLYNKEKYIETTIKSVLNQTFNDFELLIVNDGSTDSSLDVVRTFKDSRINIFTKQNGGESSARNFGIKYSKFDFIAFLDADDLWEKNYLEKIYGLIMKYPNCGLYSTNYGFKRNGRVIKAFQNDYFCETRIIDNYFVRSFDLPLITSNTAVIRKEVFEKVGLFNESLKIGPDLEMWFRIMLEYKMAFHPYVGAIYNLDAEGRVMNNKREPNIIFIQQLNKLLKERLKDNFYIKRYIEEVALRELIYVSQTFPQDITLTYIKEFYYLGVIDPFWYKFRNLFSNSLFFRIIHKIYKYIIKRLLVIKYTQSQRNIVLPKNRTTS